MDGLILNCPYFFETWANNHEEGLYWYLKCLDEGWVQNKWQSAEGQSLERLQLIRLVEGMVNSWFKGSLKMVKQLGQLKFHELIKATIK